MPPSPPNVTPQPYLDRWKKLWGTPVRLTDIATEEAFEAFQDAFVPGHMHKMFLKRFGTPKAEFNNRFFADGSMFRDWNTTIGALTTRNAKRVEVTVIFGSPERLEGHALKGEARRTLRDIVLEDRESVCAIVKVDGTTLYVFSQYRMRGCVVLTVRGEGEIEEELGEPEFID